ncbi:hypothetical protein EHP00_1375 [Ecytonucleospora hepatopenaei]|uniref:Ribosome biogenesis regulatory protein n=1 Tax=Ecytonucleospora hepatopenaei TaxID=646526 RepID=A0A1W0E2X0_9MICR|nr:hypothetical protein EHP00_1375 [Ecytonucleospora hepatopenaei]
MSSHFKIIQSHLCVDTDEMFAEKVLFDAITNVKNEIKKNKSKYIEGVKIFETKNDSDAFPTIAVENKPMTRWEKFAKDKGIKSAKKGRRVWNEETKEWEYRYGSNSIQNQKLREGIVEGKKSVSQLKKEKKERAEKNKKAMLKNKERAKNVDKK